MHQRLFHRGTELVSVTSLQAIVAKPFLERWKKDLCECTSCQNEPTSYAKPRPGRSGICGFKMAERVADEAADFSNAIHAEVAQYLNDGVLMDNATEWSKKIIYKMREGEVAKYLIDPETTLRCNEANLSGSPDMVCKGFGKTFIGDNKIKKSMDLATGAQLYGYRLLIRKLHGEDINTGAVFFGNKKSGTLVLKWIDLDDWKKYFESLIVVWNRHNPNRMIDIKALR